MTAKLTDGHATGVDNLGHQRRDTVRVIVIYPAAAKPFKTTVDRDTTLAQIKAAALNDFELQETEAKKFKIFHGGKEYLDMQETIGHIAGKHQEVVFQLEEYITQG